MGFDNKYPNRKDWRKDFIKAKSVDYSCRNHGSCSHCVGNRIASKQRVIEAAIYEQKTAITHYDEGCLACLQEECNCIEEFEENELPGILIFNKNGKEEI